MKTLIWTTNRNSSELASYIRALGFHFVPWVWWPEIRDGIPLHPREILAVCEKEFRTPGATIVTLSEHVLLWHAMMVQTKEMRPTDVAVGVYTGTGVVEVSIDTQGKFVGWPGPFFNERMALLR